MADVNVSIGANLDDFISGMRAMVADLRQATVAVQAQAASALRAGAAFDGATTAVRKTSDVVRDLKKPLEEVGASIRGVVEKAKGVPGGFSAVAEKLANVSLAFQGVQKVVQGVGKAFSEPLRQFGRFEDASTRLAPLVGGLDLAKALCKELRDEAANGTASFESLAATSGKLASVFGSTAEIRKWTSAFHNLSAGLGRDINELVENFVRSKASGRFEGGFLDMFAQKGVNIFAPLEASTGKTAKELREMATTGKLAFADVEKAILSTVSAGGAFQGMAEKMSGTFSGSVGTLKEEWNSLLAELAEPLAETLTPILQKVAELVRSVRPVVASLIEPTLAFGGIAAGAAALWKMSAAADVLLKKFPQLQTVAAPFIRMFSAVEAQTMELVSSVGLAIVDKIKAVGFALSSAALRVKGFFGDLIARSALATRALAGLRAGISALGVALGAVGLRVKSFFEGIVAFAGKAKAAIAALVGALSLVGAAWAGWSIGREIKMYFVEKEMDKQRSAAEKYTSVLARLQEGYDKMDAARTVAELDRAKAAIEGNLEVLEKTGAAWREAAGMGGSGLNIAAAREGLSSGYDRRRREIALSELSDAEKRAADLRKLIDEARAQLDASTASVYDRRQNLLGDLGTVEKLDAEIAALGRLTEATADQETRLKKLLETKNKIAEIDRAAAANAAGLRQRVELMRAELAGAEALAAKKEEILRADLTREFLSAGYSAEGAAKAAEKFLALQRQVEEKRRRDSAREAVVDYTEDLKIQEARARGEERLAKQLELQKQLREEIAALQAKGVDAAEAEALAAQKYAAQSAVSREAVIDYEEDLKIQEARERGEKRLAKQLELQKRMRGEVAALREKGAEEDEAQSLVRRKYAAQAKRLGVVFAPAENAVASVGAGMQTPLAKPVSAGSAVAASAFPAAQSATATGSLVSIAQNQLNVLTSIRGFVEKIAGGNTASATFAAVLA